MVQRLGSLHMVRAEIVIHGAGEKDREFSEQFGGVVKARRGKAIKVVKVPRVVAVDHGFRFSGEQFFQRQNQMPAVCSIGDRRSVHFLRGKSAGPHQKIDFYLNAVGSARVICESEMPFPQRVVVDPVLNPVTETNKDLLDSPNDFWAFLER